MAGSASTAGTRSPMMFLNVGNVFTFGILLATLPIEERFREFRTELGI